MHTASKQIGLESPGCSGFEANILSNCDFLAQFVLEVMYLYALEAAKLRKNFPRLESLKSMLQKMYKE